MANILINNETYTGVHAVRFPLASDNTKCAVYGYLWDGDGDYLINLRQGSITLNGATLTVYDRNKVKYEFTGASNQGGYCNMYDYEKNQLFSNSYNQKNVLQETPIFRFKQGDSIRVVVTSNTASDINVTGNKVSFNFIAPASDTTVTNLLASDYGITHTRDSENKTIVSEGTFNRDVEVGAMVFYIFSSCTTPLDVTIEIYLNNEQIL